MTTVIYLVYRDVKADNITAIIINETFILSSDANKRVAELFATDGEDWKYRSVPINGFDDITMT